MDIKMLLIVTFLFPICALAAENSEPEKGEELSAFSVHPSPPNPLEWVPTLNFDGAAGQYCYPDVPSNENNGKCADFNRDAPVYWEGQYCSSKMYKLAYWFWYGWQKPCIGDMGKHDNDWEHIVLNFEIDNSDKFNLQSVTYFQHSGYYTREWTTGDLEIWVGKIGHGSYHNKCDGKGTHLDPGFCDGGCGYWEDFRNDINGVHWKPTNLRSLDVAKLAPGPIGERVSDVNYCDLGACKGKNERGWLQVLKAPTKKWVDWEMAYGCWQNNATVNDRLSTESSKFDAPLFFECSGARLSSNRANAKAVTKIHSYHNNKREDREWTFHCSSLNQNPARCKWTGNINDWDAVMDYTAPGNAFVTGFESVHSNKREDRRWKLKVCEQRNNCRSGCSWTGWLNDFDGMLDHSTGNKVIAGIKSVHNNKREDRRWNFLECNLETCPVDAESQDGD